MKKIELAKEEIQKIVATGNQLEIAKLVGEPYDPELSLPEVISEVFATDSVEPGEPYEYFVPAVQGKVVYTLVSCAVTNTQVTPASDNDLSFSTYTTERFWICLDDLLNARYNVVANKTENMLEAMDRLEVAKVIALIDAAVPVANEFAPDTGDTKLTFPKLVQMVRAMAKYAKRFVLVTGANITADLMLLNYDADKVQALKLSDIGIDKVIALDGQVVSIDGVATDVIDADVAYLIAVGDKKGNKAGDFVRRKVASLASLNADSQIVAKERIVLPSGAPASIGATQKLGWAYIMAEQFGAVVKNAQMLAKFSRP